MWVVASTTSGPIPSPGISVAGICWLVVLSMTFLPDLDGGGPPGMAMMVATTNATA
jgi:hypothetical protein